MVGPRDIGWGIALGVLLAGLAQGYPLWSARRVVERDAEEAFAHVFEGRRMADGTLVEPPGSAAAPRAFTAPIYFRRMDAEAAQIDWNGKHASFLFKHIIGFDQTLDQANPTHEVLVRMEKRGGAFTYAEFQVRGIETSQLAIEGNPWFPLMNAAAGAEPRRETPRYEMRATDVMQ
jgi:hypothetical protein